MTVRHFFLGTFFLVWLCSAFAMPFSAHADEVYPAKVLNVTNMNSEALVDFGIGGFLQALRVEVKTPEGKKEVTFQNDFVPVEEGDRIYVRYYSDDGEEGYSMYDINRSGTLWMVLGLFVGLTLLFGGWKSVRSLISLAVSVSVIFFVLLPLLAKGYAPMTWGVFICVLLLALVMLITHGFNTRTYAAFLGTTGAVVATGILAYFVVKHASFTGLGSEEQFALLVLGSEVDLPQLLLAGIIIGMIGVLDDVSITQASVVFELKKAGVKGKDLYKRAMHVGREHVGALINTLILAYAGASMPLLLLLTTYNEPFGVMLSVEVVATEILRSLLGSIGLVLAVPLTTFLAALFEDDGKGESHTHGH